MNILEIIEKKQKKEELSNEELEFFINEYVAGNIADYQASALLMAIFINGLNSQETSALTMAMAKSGEILEFSKEFNKIVVDKHSTGGVGDKVSICLLPLVASLGVVVAKMSGRGLGFTGGTVDKMNSIPGYKTEVDMDEFKNNVKKLGISMIAQTAELAPADKKLYELRDSINCVENISLIASSIMSKKIASGADKIVIDVTVGKGAFMKNIEEAQKLAKEMIEIGKMVNKEVVCVMTDMNQPLGYAIGNNLEVIEAIKFLKGDMPEDLKQVVLELGAYMIKLADLGDNIEENKQKLLENIQNGKAYEKFMQMVQNQGGDISYLECVDKFEKAKLKEEIIAKKSGTIKELDAEKIGKVVCNLGAGRLKKIDEIDYTVGVLLNKKIGETVNPGECLATVFANDMEKMEQAKRDLEEIFIIGENAENEINNEVILNVCN